MREASCQKTHFIVYRHVGIIGVIAIIAVAVAIAIVADAAVTWTGIVILASEAIKNTKVVANFQIGAFVVR